ncbi:hypothetical protein ABT126_41805 [Streptomyces sp. NPDC002012]|uniref:hypothetical protein n=1 Tax=Streptomyces sp. NPDC002012 TaxID=3154532 RepID=UPI00332A0929
MEAPTEPGEMVLGQPVVQRRGQQQDLVRVERPKTLVHRRRTALRLLRPDRLDLEQTLPTTHAEIIPHLITHGRSAVRRTAKTRFSAQRVNRGWRLNAEFSARGG